MQVDLTSVAGVALFVLAVVQAIKVAFAGKKYDVIPIFVWVLVVSAVSTLLIKEAGYVALAWGQFFAQVVLAALLSSGLFSTVKYGTNTLDGAPVKNPYQFSGRDLLLLFGAACLTFTQVGCFSAPNAKDRAFYAGVKALWNPIKNDWAPRVESATDLTDSEKQNRIGTANSLASEMDALIADRGKEFDNVVPAATDPSK